jgi:hypothetical protein
MSRVAMMLFTTMLLTAQNLSAQNTGPSNGAVMIDKSKKLTAIDKNGCLKSDDPKEIVVCGESEDTKSQRVFRGQKSNPRFANGGAQNSQAAACIPGTGCIPAMQGGVKIGFGKVPPPAIPLEEVYRGLPEPDMVVEEGSDPE